MEEVWTVVQWYGTQSMLKTGLDRPLMREILVKPDGCEGRMSEILIDLATDGNETISPIKMTHQESNQGMLHLSRTRKRIMRSKMVIDKINDMKMKLGSKFKFKELGWQNWTLIFQVKMPTQLNESE